LFIGFKYENFKIYHSVHHHNTLKVAEAMAQAVDADLEDVSEVNQDMLDEYDVVGIGSGIYYGKPHKKSKVSSNT
jgi:menaquinone-dependent protoporphyrinogen IX oxidase